MITAFTTRKNDTLKFNLIHFNLVFPLYTVASFDLPSFPVIFFFTTFPLEGLKKAVNPLLFYTPPLPLTSDKRLTCFRLGNFKFVRNPSCVFSVFDIFDHFALLYSLYGSYGQHPFLCYKA